MKSHLRISKANGSTKRRVDKIIARGERFTRRKWVAADRPHILDFLKGGRIHE